MGRPPVDKRTLARALEMCRHGASPQEVADRLRGEGLRIGWRTIHSARADERRSRVEYAADVVTPAQAPSIEGPKQEAPPPAAVGRTPKAKRDAAPGRPFDSAVGGRGGPAAEVLQDAPPPTDRTAPVNEPATVAPPAGPGPRKAIPKHLFDQLLATMARIPLEQQDELVEQLELDRLRRIAVARALAPYPEAARAVAREFEQLAKVTR